MDGASSPVAAELVLQPIVAIGCGDCDGDTLITPTVIALLADGRIAELDRFEPFVRVFDQEGKAEVTFGAPGQGPGELGTNTGGMFFSGVFLLPWPDGALSVLELMSWTLESFASNGEFLGQSTLDLPLASPSAQAFSPTTGTYYRHSFVPVVAERPDVLERCSIELAGPTECEQLTTATELTGVQPDSRFAQLSIATTPDGGLIVVDAATYRLWWLDDEGSVLRQVRRAIPPPLKSEEELDAEREANRRRVASGRDEREIDPNRPFVARSGLQVDGEGRLWILTQRYTDDSWVFDVLDKDGNILDEVTVAALTVFDGYQITPFAVAGDRLAIIANQPDGSARINVYRIVGR